MVAPGGEVVTDTRCQTIGSSRAHTGSVGMYRLASFISANAAADCSCSASRSISGRAVSRAQRSRDPCLTYQPNATAVAMATMVAAAIHRRPIVVTAAPLGVVRLADDRVCQADSAAAI